MNVLLPVIVGILTIIVIALLLNTSMGKHPDTSKKANKKKPLKDRNTILKEANRRLAANPKDPEALEALGGLYFEEQAWDRALKIYETLADICGANPDLDEFEINLRFGLSALKLNKLDHAYKGLHTARSLNQDHFELNFNLGYLEYIRKNFDKSVQILAQANKQNPEHSPTLRYYGHALFRSKSYKEALNILRRAIDLEPEDKESVFAMAECYYNLSNMDQAIKIFTHLRTDPLLGPNASLFAGTIHLNQRQFPKAIMDFEIGLKHPDIKIETLVELKYRLATAYLRQPDISKAVSLLLDIQEIYPGYKDITAQILKYKELNANRNLQIYLLASTTDFVTLCRKLTLSFFPKAKVKITDIAVTKNEYADILAEIETSRWSDIVLFRFIRASGQIGELIVRDLHAKIKDLKAGKGYCISAGQFTEEAKKFVEARLIDLIEKDATIKRLNQIDSGNVIFIQDEQEEK